MQITMEELVSKLEKEEMSFEKNLSGYSVDVNAKTIEIQFKKYYDDEVTEISVKFPIDISTMSQERVDTECFDTKGNKIMTFPGNIQKLGFNCSIDFSKEGFVSVKIKRVQEKAYINDSDNE